MWENTEGLIFITFVVWSAYINDGWILTAEWSRNSYCEPAESNLLTQIYCVPCFIQGLGTQGESKI